MTAKKKIGNGSGSDQAQGELVELVTQYERAALIIGAVARYIGSPTPRRRSELVKFVSEYQGAWIAQASRVLNGSSEPDAHTPRIIDGLMALARECKDGSLLPVDEIDDDVRSMLKRVGGSPPGEV